MKTILKYSMFVWISFLLFGCTSDFIDSYQETDISDLSDISVGQEAEEFGRQMGDNLRYVVTQMNENGDDFTDLTKIKIAIVKYVSQNTHSTPISIGELNKTSLQKRHQLTPIQLMFMEKIRDAQAKSRSANEFTVRLKEIIKEIQTTVPEIQQRNLLKATVALFYLTKEIDSLLKEGLMPVDLKQPQHIRLKSGGNESSIWAAFWAGLCVSTADIGSALLADLAAAAITAGGYLLAIGSCLFLTGDTDNVLSDAECLARYSSCMDTPLGNTNSGGYGSTMCGNCLSYCYAQHVWDCPRP